MNESAEGLFSRIFSLLNDQVLMVAGLMLLGIAFSYALTNFLKPWMKSGRKNTALRIRALAFVVAVAVTYLLLRGLTGLDAGTELICAALSGLLTPIAFDLIHDWLPRLRPNRRPE